MIVSLFNNLSKIKKPFRLFQASHNSGLKLFNGRIPRVFPLTVLVTSLPQGA